jgi:hypothetical protein
MKRALILILALASWLPAQSIFFNANYDNAPTVAAPTFGLAGGSYAGTQSVSISSATSGATICYTTDGTDPAASTPGSCTTGSTYSASVSVASSLTLKAIASKSGMLNSSVSSAEYTITVAPSFVQGVTWTAEAVNTNISISSVGSGHCLVVGVYSTGDATTETLTSSGDTWALATGQSSPQSVAIYYAVAAAAGSRTIRVANSNLKHEGGVVAEFSNISCTPDGVRYATSFNSTTTFSTGAFTASSGDLLIGFGNVQGSSAQFPDGISAGAGFTLPSTAVGHCVYGSTTGHQCGMEYQILSGSSATATMGKQSTGSNVWLVGAAFK